MRYKDDLSLFVEARGEAKEKPRSFMALQMRQQGPVPGRRIHEGWSKKNVIFLGLKRMNEAVGVDAKLIMIRRASLVMSGSTSETTRVALGFFRENSDLARGGALEALDLRAWGH